MMDKRWQKFYKERYDELPHKTAEEKGHAHNEAVYYARDKVKTKK